MAYFENLTRRCRDCPSPVTMAVYIARGRYVGEYCNACGTRRVERLDREEKAAAETQRATTKARAKFAPPKGWAREDVRLARPDGSPGLTVTGVVHPDAPGLAVTQAVGADVLVGRFAITHERSGLKTLVFGTLGDACAGALAMAPLADWTLPTTAIAREGLSELALAATAPFGGMRGAV